MIVEDQLDCGAPRISGVEQLEAFDELSAAMAISHERMDLAGQQFDPGHQTEGAMTFVLMIPRKAGVDAGLGRQIRRRRCDSLDSRLFITGDELPPACPSSICQKLFSEPRLHDRHTEPRPSSVRIRRRGSPDSSAPCAA